MGDKLNVQGPDDLGDFERLLEQNLKRAKEDPEYVKTLSEGKFGNPMSLGPRVATAESWAEDMQTAAKNKSAKWLKNTLAPKKDPRAAAKKAAKKYENNMRKALDDKTWEKGIDTYDMDLRQKTIEAVGESGFSTGITNKGEKITAKIGKLQPLVAALADTLDKMPIDTPEQRAAKMVAARDGMLKIKGEMRK